MSACLRPITFLLLGLLLSPAAPAATDAELAAAAEAADGQKVRRLLEHSVEVNAAQVDGMTALHWAAYHDDHRLVEALVSAGADVSAANRYGVTPLSLACTNGNGAIVERLLDAGADPNATLSGGEAALMTASRTGRVRAVEALLEGGADVHAKDSQRGQTALMWAAAEGNVEVLRLLIEVGADFRAPLDSGFTPLLFAAREGKIEVVRELVKMGVDVNETTPLEATKRERPLPGGRTVRPGANPLLIAVTNAHYDVAALLLDAGADPNAGPGYTALHALPRVRKTGGGDNNPSPDGSGMMTDLDFVRDMVAHGADLDARMTAKPSLANNSFNELGATPFMTAAIVADAELMRKLAELGADPSLRNEENSTALMAAAGLGTRSPGEDAGTEEEVVEAVQVALDLGADVDAVNDDGETAMHGAAYKNLPKAVELLAANGADIEIWNRHNKYGWTPLSIARGYRRGNFKPSPVTVAAVEKVMLAAGVRPPTEEEEGAKGFDIYAKPYGTEATKPAPGTDGKPLR